VELILAILVAGPVGYLTSTRKRGLLTYLALWAIVFPVQTVVVYSTSDDGSDLLWVGGMANPLTPGRRSGVPRAIAMALGGAEEDRR
jgi:hypothetical protein